jgi:hypothetical protein
MVDPERTRRVIEEVFGEAAPFAVGVLVLFTGLGGAGLFAMGLQAGAALAGAVAAAGAFAAGVGTLALLLRK